MGIEIPRGTGDPACGTAAVRRGSEARMKVEERNISSNRIPCKEVERGE
jgi:hypothetical protein